MLVEQAGRKMHEFEIMPAIILENPLAVEKEILKLRGELAAIGDIDETLLKEAQDAESRHSFLSQQLADLEKSSEDLKELIADLDNKIHAKFKDALIKINEEFNKYCRLMFGGGQAKLFLERPRINEDKKLIDAENSASEDKEIKEDELGIEVHVSIPGKKIKGLDMLSGGERSLVSIAALFAMVSVSPPPFLVLDEVDAALDERNAKKFANVLKEFSKHTQFILVTHNRHTMEAASVLYGVTMQSDGTSKLLSVKLEEVKGSAA
jgi:chromosome segregation protein